MTVSWEMVNLDDPYFVPSDFHMNYCAHVPCAEVSLSGDLLKSLGSLGKGTLPSCPQKMKNSERATDGFAQLRTSYLFVL